MRAFIKNALNDVAAVVDGKNVRSINRSFVEFYIPKDETTIPMLKMLTNLALAGGTVSFEPNYSSTSRGECIYLAVKSEYVVFDWEA